LLFLIYINDFPSATDLYSLLYADDTTLYAESDSIDSLYTNTNIEMGRIESWFTANQLTLHPAKTRYMLYSSTQPGSNTITLMGQPIKRVHEKGDERSFKLVVFWKSA
jgi:hypothetical protein